MRFAAQPTGNAAEAIKKDRRVNVRIISPITIPARSVA
jgi:predicted DNA binding CopG/RHH family protein